MVVGLSYCPETTVTYTTQGYLQCTYGRRAIGFIHEQYGERSSTDQQPKHQKIPDRLCYRFLEPRFFRRGFSGDKCLNKRFSWCGLWAQLCKRFHVLIWSPHGT